jgi:hypothetical protein
LEQLPDKLLPDLKAQSPALYVFWREICHIVGSFILVIISHALFLVFTLPIPMYVFIALSLWIFYQEFFLHPKKYNQPMWKGVLDFASWTIPFILYFLLVD